ncbi:MAG TPA: dTDP-4-dehydrorhamnose 3,5-epimerase family protein [Mycobacteriales bacterium]|nr:dTDP-4-dehydrorhamnose 3,5-epimerase family protein [Mycobacteriales bacterium]
MKSRELTVPDAWEFTPAQFPDDRGVFLNWFVRDAVEAAVGHAFTVAMTNHSVSRKGVVRGVHYALVPPSQAKYVYCPQGAFLDIIVDVRVGSPTFGQSDVVRLDTVDYRGVYVAEGLGHAAVALEDDSVLCYLCSTGYNPEREKGITPLDPALGLQLPSAPVLSEKDTTAPTLHEARDQGLLPDYQECRALYDSLR